MQVNCVIIVIFGLVSCFFWAHFVNRPNLFIVHGLCVFLISRRQRTRAVQPVRSQLQLRPIRQGGDYVIGVDCLLFSRHSLCRIVV